MQIIDPSHSFYRPLWVRLLIVASCLFWTGVEIYAGEMFWAVLIGAVAIYSAYVLLATYKPQPEKPGQGEGGA